MEKEFIDLIKIHAPIIYKVCNLYYDDAEDRRDLFQEIVLQLWKSFKNFRNESKWSTWMYRVALNTAISNFRKDSRKPVKKSLSASEFQIPDLNESSAADNKTGLFIQQFQN